jgi:hypothetical protein
MLRRGRDGGWPAIPAGHDGVSLGAGIDRYCNRLSNYMQPMVAFDLLPIVVFGLIFGQIRISCERYNKLTLTIEKYAKREAFICFPIAFYELPSLTK